MSTLRNIGRYLWHGGIVRKANVVLGFAGAGLAIAACSADPTSPTANAATPHFSTAATSTTSGTDAQLQATLASEQKRTQALGVSSQATYEQIKTQWDAFIKQNPSPTRTSPFLMCEPLQYAAGVQIVGPDGGDIGFGRHLLHIPRGALTARTVITAEAPVTNKVEVRLSPHGLKFGVAPSLTLNYNHCYRPAAAPKSVAYVDDAMNILEWPLTSDNTTSGYAVAKLQHFSGYVVAWSRTGAQ